MTVKNQKEERETMMLTSGFRDLFLKQGKKLNDLS